MERIEKLLGIKEETYARHVFTALCISFIVALGAVLYRWMNNLIIIERFKLVMEMFTKMIMGIWLYLEEWYQKISNLLWIIL